VTLVDSPSIPQRAPAKGRILDTANELFYEDGIRNVGVDRIIAASSVTKATFYKHYRAKDNLIVDYITARHISVRHELDAVIAGATSPEDAVDRYLAALVEEISRPGFRGCPFINAAAEFPDPTHPVRQIVTAHREWYTDRLAELMRELGHERPGDAADELLLARDGAMTGGYAGDPVAAAAALTRVARHVVAEAVASTR
jgi:AcrR family transcriptional regulator